MNRLCGSDLPDKQVLRFAPLDFARDRQNDHAKDSSKPVRLDEEGNQVA